MPTAVHALVLAGLFSLPPASPARAAPVAPDTSALQFFGFYAGARLDELDARLRDVGGGRLRCRRSRVDTRVSECRAALTDSVLGGTVNLWISAIDSVAGVMTLSGTVAPSQFERWRKGLLERYGPVGTRAQGTQFMLQWVRRGRMLRLTWRLEAAGKVASVSLVDGHVLDAWGRARSRSSALEPNQKAPLGLLQRKIPDHPARLP
jgi:hypothetical protein